MPLFFEFIFWQIEQYNTNWVRLELFETRLGLFDSKKLKNWYQSDHRSNTYLSYSINKIKAHYCQLERASYILMMRGPHISDESTYHTWSKGHLFDYNKDAYYTKQQQSKQNWHVNMPPPFIFQESLFAQSGTSKMNLFLVYLFQVCNFVLGNFR